MGGWICIQYDVSSLEAEPESGMLCKWLIGGTLSGETAGWQHVSGPLEAVGLGLCLSIRQAMATGRLLRKGGFSPGIARPGGSGWLGAVPQREGCLGAISTNNPSSWGASGGGKEGGCTTRLRGLEWGVPGAAGSLTLAERPILEPQTCGIRCSGAGLSVFRELSGDSDSSQA